MQAGKVEMETNFKRILDRAHTNPEKGLAALGNVFCRHLNMSFGLNSRIWIYDKKLNVFHPLSKSMEYPPAAFPAIKFEADYSDQREIQRCFGGRTVFLYNPASASYISGNARELEFLHFSQVALLPIFTPHKSLGVAAIDFADDGGKSAASLLRQDAFDNTWHKGDDLKIFFSSFNQSLKSLIGLKNALGHPNARLVSMVISSVGSLEAGAKAALDALAGGNFSIARQAIEQALLSLSELGKNAARLPSDGKTIFNVIELVREEWKNAHAAGRINGSELAILWRGGMAVAANHWLLSKAIADVLVEASKCSPDGNVHFGISVAKGNDGKQMLALSFNHHGPKIGPPQGVFPENDPLSYARSMLNGENCSILRTQNGPGQSFFILMPLGQN